MDSSSLSKCLYRPRSKNFIPFQRSITLNGIQWGLAKIYFASWLRGTINSVQQRTLEAYREVEPANQIIGCSFEFREGQWDFTLYLLLPSPIDEWCSFRMKRRRDFNSDDNCQKFTRFTENVWFHVNDKA